MDLIDDPQPGENAPEFTVTEISGAVKRVIEGEFGRVRVRGEVGRVFVARSGHLYFDLKDDRNVLAAVSWKGQVSGLATKPEEGMEVIATGRLTTFGSQSKYQLNVEDIRPAGVGALMAMLEKRKKALAAEGLFDEARKKPIPYLPEVIGVVTSPSGAVIRDILHRLRERFPRRVLVWPVAVQGERCAAEVAAAIAGFNALTPGGSLPRPDLLIVARGGGSIEDLWGFNEEIVARAAAASAIPLISAVGHETDTTLIDYVSDRRAPTPTAAAEMAVPVRADLAAWLSQAGARASGALVRGLGQRRQRLGDLTRALPRAEGLTASARQRLDFAETRLDRGLEAAVARKRHALAEVSGAVRPATLAGRLRDKARHLGACETRLAPALRRAVADRGRALAQLGLRLRPETARRDMAEAARKLADLDRRLVRAAATRRETAAERLRSTARMLTSLGYESTLRRGYAVVWDGDRLVLRADAVGTAVTLEIQFADGRVTVATGGTPPKPRARPPGGGEQGSLF